MNGIFLMLCADLAFAWMAAAAKLTGQEIPAAQIIFVRSLLSSAALAVMLKRARIPFAGKEPGLLWARGIVGYTALQCYFWSLPQLTLGTAVMLNYTAPIFAVALSLFTLKESPPRTVAPLLALSFFGVYLIASPRTGGAPAALLAGLASGLLAGFVHVLIRLGHKSDSPLLVIFYFTLSSTVGSGLLLAGSGWTPPDARQWAGLLFITASSFAGQLCLTYALRKAPVWVVSPFGYLTPVMGLGLGYLVWGEVPPAEKLAGGAIVIVCGAWMLRLYRKLRSDTVQ